MTPNANQYREAVAHLRQLESTYEGPMVKLQCALRHLEPAPGSANPCDLVRESFGLLTDGTLLASPWAVNSRGFAVSDDWVLGNLATTRLATILDQPRARAYRARLDENFGHCKVFAFHASAKTGPDRIFDAADPLYVQDVSRP